MKIIRKVARAELQSLFYSPVAWVILIAFTFMAGMNFTDQFGDMVQRQELNHRLYGITSYTYAGMRGLFTVIQNYLYMFIPLLTMGLMSRELSSGTVRLLYSSPVTNTQIILGKYLSMIVYALVLIFILFVFALFGMITIQNVDIWPLFSALLGLFLLTCAYAAIGLFMSSLTSYQIVAAIGTLAVLAGLSYVGRIGQNIELVRDITYWFSINGRAGEMVNGMICSEDILYFLVVIALFLSLSIIRMQALRQKSSWKVSIGKYTTVILISMCLGYFSSRPTLRFFYDTTHTKMLTITPNTQRIMEQMKGGLTITTYSNFLDKYSWIVSPNSVNQDLNRFKQYFRFKPEIKMKYVYYYDKADNPSLDRNYPDLNDHQRMVKMSQVYRYDTTFFKSPDEIRKIIDLEPEGNRFVRLLERANGEKTFLRVFDDMQVLPSESEYAAAFKRLVMELPKVAFLTGHGERDFEREGDRGYRRFAMDKPFRYALINQGFDFEVVSLHSPIPSQIDILVIADMRNPMTAEEQKYLDEYIARGGNLVIAGDIRRQDVMNPVVAPLGVRFMPGQLVKASEDYQADLIFSHPLKEAADISYIWAGMIRRENIVSMPGATALEYTTDKGFTVTPIFASDTVGSWNELETTNFIDDTVRLNPGIGEVEKSWPTVLALSRKVGEKEQKILVLGDADCLSNGEISMSRKNVPAANFNLIMGAFYWMSDEEVPIDVRRPPLLDNKIFLSGKSMRAWKIVLMWIFPILLFGGYLIIWFRRRGR